MRANNRSSSSLQSSRRGVLRGGLLGGIGLTLGGPHAIAHAQTGVGADGFSDLLPPDSNGIQLPPGFSSRVIATTGQTFPNGYTWISNPDGGAVFPTEDGGWIYACNDESSGGNGGVGAIRFDADGNGIDAYQILTGTTRNCAGGRTPWGTWLSCEETSTGQVWECDPYAPNSQGVVRPLMGRFNHEAAAVDPVNRVIYLTEDAGDGLLYRFIPTNYPDLSSGTLQCAIADDPISLGVTATLSWVDVPDPTLQGSTPLKDRVPGATPFNRGEGCWYENGLLYFATTGNNRVYRLNSNTNAITVVYDFAQTGGPLTAPDNVYVSPVGDVYVAEDSGNLEIVALTTSGQAKPFMRLTGVSGTEITGPALNPYGDRMYFNSQRNPGRTYEIMGPFLASGTVAVPGMSATGAALAAAAIATFGVAAMRRGQVELDEA